MKSKKSSGSTHSAKANPPAAEPRPTTTRVPPTQDQIQALAHAIWKDRGCPPDSDVAIWLEAERQLSGGTRGATGGGEGLPPGESVDPERSEAGRINREMDELIEPPEQRSPTSL